ncbi:MAG TPA: DUF4389 domain-containing protein [Gaiellaceae bacterium]|nr:DUF4389 domain-containing protein [Gaiellaceae bacterium]
MDVHPVQLVVQDDLARSRPTVFFRLLLAIPHIVWLFLWTLLTVLFAVVTWLATLVSGQPPAWLHRYMCAYVRYQVHLTSYLVLAANPYPPFDGRKGEYPIDVTLPEPEVQSRWTTLFRIFLAIPALLISSAFSGSGGLRFSSGSHRSAGTYSGGGALFTACAFLGWFACLVRGRMPKGLRDAGAYGVGYGAQVLAYLLFVTGRYPNADPTAMLAGVERPPEHPVRLVGEAHDLRRSRVTVFFRLLLALPHVVWLALWAVAAILAAVANWFVTLVRGTPAAALHGFLSRFVRYRLHVYAFLSLAANPFPAFGGRAGSYPLDLELPEPGRQNRWKTGFRIVLVIPAAIVNGALEWGLFVAAVLTWFAALVKGTAPWGLRNLMAYALRYDAQVNAYGLLLTDVYPNASPLEGAAAQPDAFDDTL